MSSPPPQYDDPFSDGRASLLQSLAVLATVGEAAARFAVTNVHHRATRIERRARAVALADQVQAEARADEGAAARALIGRAFDSQWLGRAGSADVAGLWRTAALYAATGDAQARQALRLAEARLREIHPLLMEAYVRHRAAGLNLADAMRAAVWDLWRHLQQPRTRPHPGKGPGITAHLDDALRGAVGSEVARLADGVDPDLVDGLARRARATGRAPAADAATRLSEAARRLRAEAQLGGYVTGTATIRRGVNHPSDYQRPPTAITASTEEVPVRSASAGLGFAADALDQAAAQARAHQAEAAHLDGLADQQHRAATIDSGQADLPATPGNEHHDGLDSGHRHHGLADQHAAAAEQQARLGRAFRPLTVVDPATGVPPTPTMRPSQRRGRTR